MCVCVCECVCVCVCVCVCKMSILDFIACIQCRVIERGREMRKERESYRFFDRQGYKVFFLVHYY